MVSRTSDGASSNNSAISTIASLDTVRISSCTRCSAGNVTACFRGYFGMYARMRSRSSSLSTDISVLHYCGETPHSSFLLEGEEVGLRISLGLDSRRVLTVLHREAQPESIPVH